MLSIGTDPLCRNGQIRGQHSDNRPDPLSVMYQLPSISRLGSEVWRAFKMRRANNGITYQQSPPGFPMGAIKCFVGIEIGK